MKLVRFVVPMFSFCLILLTSLSSCSQGNREVNQSLERIEAVVGQYPEILQMHGFYKDKVDMVVKFDLVIDFDTKNKKALRDEIAQRVQKLFADYEVSIAVDYDYSE